MAKKHLSHKKQNANAFNKAVEEGIRRDFGKKQEFASRVGYSRAWVSDLLDPSKSPDAATAATVIAAFTSPVSQRRVRDGYKDAFLPLPDLPKGLSTAELIASMNELVSTGYAQEAITWCKIELKQQSDPVSWAALAERLARLYLQLGEVSDALAVCIDLREKANGWKNSMLRYAAASLLANVLLSIDDVSEHKILKANGEVFDIVADWAPRSPSEARERDNRRYSTHRSAALAFLKIFRSKFQKRTITRSADAPEILKLAEAEVLQSFQEDTPDFLKATGLEVRSRIEYILGDVPKAVETLDELREFGEEKGWDVPAKAAFMRARILRSKGELDEACEILTALKESGIASGKSNDFRRADQELANLLIDLHG